MFINCSWFTGFSSFSATVFQLHGGVKKSGLIGFCDPCPGEAKQLKVIYTFRNKKFEVIIIAKFVFIIKTSVSKVIIRHTNFFLANLGFYFQVSTM